MRQALVLGGGGVVGVAWETGVVCGLLEEGVDLRAARAIVGTSAGSLIGARLAAQQDLRDARTGVAIPAIEGGPDVATLTAVFGRWANAERVDAEFLREIGALAARARTITEDAWIAATGGSLGFEEWPHDRLKLVAVDVETGHLGVHDRASGATLERAVAASCAVPGMFPPITIRGRRYMDGGVRSGTSADLLLPDEPDVVLVIAPIARGSTAIGALAERCLDAEIAALEAAGAQVVKVLPDAADRAAFGPNLMDPAQADSARQAGVARGRALAEGLASLWKS
jgi:NTE family protein